MNIKAISLILVLAVYGFANHAWSQSSKDAATPVTRYQGAKLFDGKAFVKKDICISGDTIVRCTEDVTTIIDLSGHYITPPFADAHTHGFDGPFGIDVQTEQALSEGVFYAMNMTAPTRSVNAIRDQLSGPGNVDVASATGGITGPESHPAEVYEALALRIYDYNKQIRRKEEIRASRLSADNAYYVVKDRTDIDRKWPKVLAGKPDFIKVFLRNSNRYDEGYGKWGPGGGIDPKLLPYLRALTRERGLRLAVAASNVHDYRAGLENAADIITHLPCYQDTETDPDSPYYDLDSAEECLISYPEAERSAQQNMASVLIISEWEKDRPGKYVAWERHNVAMLVAAGAPLALGVNSYGASYRSGLIAGAKKGFFSTTDILRLATMQTTQIIFPKRKVGCLDIGCEASFLAFKNDPAYDITAINAIAYSIKQGVTVQAMQ